MLPVQAFAFSLVLHMTQHFLFAGFGLRLLCDWTVFLRRHGCALGAPFLSFVRETGLDRFTAAVTRLCTAHLGLREEEVPWLGLLQTPRPEAVSYTHLDVYKRQAPRCCSRAGRGGGCSSSCRCWRSGPPR